MSRRYLAFMAVLTLLPAPALAHPHVWTDTRSSLIVDAQGRISGVRVEWAFDENYTTFALEGLDTNGNGSYEPDEIKPLTDENIKSLVESNYFVVMRQAGKVLPQGKVTDYAQTYNQTRLTLYFVLPLQTPVDPRGGEFQYKIYDPDFFIAFDYVKEDPVELEGSLPQGCAMELKPLPTDEELDQTREFLASKDKDWQNETQEDFGALFAQPVVVTCKS